MEVKAKLRHYHVAPRKVRLIADLIRGLDVERAKEQLQHQNKRSSGALLKLLNSAIANAVNNFSLKKENLYIKKSFVDQGPSLKRWKPRAHGRAGRILKKTSHVTLVLEEKIPSKLGSKKNKNVSKDKVKIETKKLSIQDLKGTAKKNKGDSKSNNSNKTNGPRPKLIKSFIRKTGDK